MKRVWLLVLVLCCLAHAVVFRVDPTPVMTTAGNVPIGGYPQLFAVPGASVSIYTDSAGTILATTYTDATGSTTCPTTAQVVLAGTSLCVATSSPQGNFGFWLASGTYYYRITLPNGTTGGPYPVTATTSALSFPVGQQTQYFKITPNAGNSTTYQWANLPAYFAADYNFPAQSPGGSLSSGTNTITLTPVPLGVNGSDQNHRLWVQGGTGTAEACLINGGSGTAGAASGAIQISCSNSHTGAWTIQSATAGIQEAAQSAGSGVNAQFILPAGDSTVYASVNLPIAGSSGHFGNLAITGQGMSVTQIRRAASFTSGDVFSFDTNRGGVAAITIAAMDIISQSANITSGAGVHIANTSAQTVTLRDLKVLDGYQSVLIDHAGSVTIDNVYAVNDATYNGLGGTRSNGGLIFTGVGSNNKVVDSAFVTTDFSSSTTWSQGLYVGGCDGLQISNSAFSGLNGITFDPSTIQVTNFYGANLILDSSVQRGIQFSAPGMGVVAGNINLTSPQIVSYAKTGAIPSALYGIDFPGGVNGWTMISISNPVIAGWQNDGIRFLGSAKAGPITITGGSITDIGTSGSHGVGIAFQNGVGGIHITGMDIGGVTPGTSQYMDWNFQGDTASSASYPDWSIVGNNVRLHAQGDWLNFPGSSPVFTNSTITGNIGVDDVIAAIASATTLACPYHPVFTITGTTNVTAVTCALSAGARGQFTATGGTITFTSGSSIGNSFIALQNVPVTYYWDGTKVWLGGQSPATSNCYDCITTESGLNNAIAGTLTGVSLAKGLCVVQSLSHSLQAGANTYNLNGGGAVAIKSHFNQTNNIATAYSGSLGTIQLCYDGSAWEDMSQ